MLHLVELFLEVLDLLAQLVILIDCLLVDDDSWLLDLVFAHCFELALQLVFVLEQLHHVLVHPVDDVYLLILLLLLLEHRLSSGHARWPFPIDLPPEQINHGIPLNDLLC